MTVQHVSVITRIKIIHVFRDQLLVFKCGHYTQIWLVKYMVTNTGRVKPMSKELLERIKGGPSEISL